MPRNEQWGKLTGYYGWPRMEKTCNISRGTFPLREGTNVMSNDGEHVGDIERLNVETDTIRLVEQQF